MLALNWVLRTFGFWKGLAALVTLYSFTLGWYVVVPILRFIKL